MAYNPADPSSLADSVRLLISDVADTPVFSDGEIGRFLSLEDDSIKRAGALALLTIASNEVLLLKYIQTNGITVDGSRVARELRANAKDLRDDADASGDEVLMVAKNRDGYDFGSPTGTVW